MQTAGLQLCESRESSKYGAAQCADYVGGCKGAGIGTSWTALCYPQFIWSGTLSGTKYWSPYLSSGIFNTTDACSNGSCPALLAFTVRCVLDLRINLETHC